MVLQGRFVRLAWYGGANAISMMLPLAVDRLAICPLLNRTLGPEIFGAMVWVIGLGFIFGSLSGNGINVTVQRDYANLQPFGSSAWPRAPCLPGPFFPRWQFLFFSHWLVGLLRLLF